MYGRWLEGGEPGLEPIDREGSFASNDLEFRGSQRWDPYDKPLETLLADWMSGSGLDRPIRPLVAGSPKPSLAADRVERLARDAQENPRGEGGPPVRSRAHWLAGLPAVSGACRIGVRRSGKAPAPGNLARLEWTDRGEPSGLALPRLDAERLAAALTELRPEPRRSAAGGVPGAGRAPRGDRRRVRRRNGRQKYPSRPARQRGS